LYGALLFLKQNYGNSAHFRGAQQPQACVLNLLMVYWKAELAQSSLSQYLSISRAVGKHPASAETGHAMVVF
jgi:hypothetical protein